MPDAGDANSWRQPPNWIDAAFAVTAPVGPKWRQTRTGATPTIVICRSRTAPATFARTVVGVATPTLLIPAARIVYWLLSPSAQTSQVSPLTDAATRGAWTS